MVKIRLARGGSKKSPFYRIVVADSRNARDSRFIERIGFFDPIALKKNNNNKKLYIRMERLEYWLTKGAQLSNRVVTLISKTTKKLQIIHKV